MMFLEKVQKTIEKYHMIEKGDSIIVGVSGGADSVALLMVLCSLQKEYQINIEAVHIHHGLRGEEADRDALFVKQLCEKWSIPCDVLEFDIAKEAKKRGIGTEEMGRICRYETFYKKAGKTAKIAVAHHQNDQAETVLLNLCRGAGLTGMSGMSPIRENIIRPFLFVSRKEIEHFLSEKGICYCQDSTNEQNHYTRNKIRLSVLPFLENEINDKAIKHIASAASILSEEETFLEELAAKGQIATQYVDPSGKPTYDIRYNPNGSAFAIEGITSPDGRVFGKMGHSERIGNGLYKNVAGEKDQKIFLSGVNYFK